MQLKAGLCSACVLLFNDFCRYNYLKIYRTNLHQVCRVGRTVAVDERSEVSFLIPHGTLLWQLTFVGIVGFYPQNCICMPFSRCQHTKSATAAQDAVKQIN